MNVKLKNAFQYIDENESSDFVGPIDESVIAKAEEEIGMEFPPSYKQFLKRYGCGDVDGKEIFGIIDADFKNSSIPDAIWLTLEERKSGLNPKLLLVYAVGDGTYYAIDFKVVNTQQEHPIVSVYLNEIGEKVADSFASFLVFLLQLK